MKKKPRIAPSNSFYSSEPAVSRTKIAAKPPVPSATLANKPNKSVPKSPGRMSGIAGFADKGRLRNTNPKISVPKLGSKMNFPTQGKARKGR